MSLTDLHCLRADDTFGVKIWHPGDEDRNEAAAGPGEGWDSPPELGWADDGTGPEGRGRPGHEKYYAVYLPHQCDEWLIGVSEDPAVVIAEAKAFRAELDTVIAALEGEQL